MDKKLPYQHSRSSKATNSSKATSPSFTSSYSESESKTPSTDGSSGTHAQRFHQQQQVAFVIRGKSYLFPSMFGVYRDSTTKLFLSEHHVSTPFMSITTNSDDSGVSPSTIVLESPTTVMATADIHSYSSKTNIVVGNTSAFLQSSGFLSPVWEFTYTFDDGHQETFHWKKSSGEAVAELGGMSKGYKLVRVSNGEVVAAWTNSAGISVDKIAKIGLLDSAREYGWGDRWEVTVVVGAIALIERDRIMRDNAATAA
ncbi:hypothetical protein NHQ30_009595 [Ciborinia camelliae]|nr:hypothetical protein NHQ30_009595 [Ciborinia camelliae]